MMADNQAHRIDRISTLFFHNKVATGEANEGFKTSGDTVIGHDIWIDSKAMIMPGVKIGSGAVIASRALLSKDDGLRGCGRKPRKSHQISVSESNLTLLQITSLVELARCSH